jgi:hypothetical protein
MNKTTESLARQIIDERERRCWFFPQGTFGEPAWELLLLLYSSEEKEQSLQALCNGILTPFSTANRWLGYLENEGLITKVDFGSVNPRIRLTPKAAHALNRYLLERLQRTGSGAERHAAGARRIMLPVAVAAATISGALTYLVAC